MIARMFAVRIRLPLIALFGVATLVLSGCTSLPGQGPSSMDIALLEEDDASDNEKYVVLQLTTEVVQAIGPATIPSIHSAFGPRIKARSRVKLGIGDRLAVNIWEPSPDGLFSVADRKETNIAVEVDEDGLIFIPYVGQIKVTGMSVRRVRSVIARGLAGKAVDPQVQVTLTNDGSHKLTVVGDVVQPGRYDVPSSGLRLIEAIALSGGSKQPSFEVQVSIVRGTTRASVRLDDVIRYANNNIWLRPRDTVQVLHLPRSFTAFGAVTSQKLQHFQTKTVSLAEALAQTGGLKDRLADAGGVFLFRYESAERLEKAGVDLYGRDFTEIVPTIYRLNFRQPQAFFMASSFMLKDKDVIYVANAPLVEFGKFMSLVVSPFLTPVRSVNSLVN